MRQRGVISLYVCLATATLWLSAAPADKTERELRALVPKILEAWATLDMTKVEPYYASDSDLVFFDIMPMKYANWAEYRAGAQKIFFESNQRIAFKINDDLQVHHRGKLAWATLTFGADITSKQGAQTHLDARWTMVFEQRQGRWVVVHEHVSAPLPSP